ncbi:hypothetical protein GCM10009710_19030 [Aeromicrobium alkaliterrae]|uniref:Septum formation initiator family protein n=2 Tax=Aeromicrobium alkaliterrae TaxID=302168 RepID=A0ABN2JU05_9ACTN
MVLLAVMVLLVASYTAQVHTWWQQRQEIRATTAEIEIRQATIDGLEDDAARFDDPAYVEQQARERFGWVLPGEVGYRVIDADGQVEGDVPQLADPPSDAEPAWYGQLWESVKVSGQKPEPKAPPADETPQAPLGSEPAGDGQ